MDMNQYDLEFKPENLPRGEEEAVAWVDIMGTRAMMEYSVKTASTNICKLHVAAIESDYIDEISLYPMLDGFYAVGDSIDYILDFVQDVFQTMARVQIERRSRDDQFAIYHTVIPKASIAYGTIYQGKNISSSQLSEHPNKNGIVVGGPIIEAIEGERDAPPFGIFLCQSATESSGGKVVEWWDQYQFGNNLFRLLEAYYEHFENFNHKIEYDKNKMENHRREAEEYLVNYPW